MRPYGVAEPVTCDYVCEHFEPLYTDTQPHYFSLQFPEEKKTLQGTKLHALHAYSTGLPTQLWKWVCCSIATTYMSIDGGKGTLLPFSPALAGDTDNAQTLLGHTAFS